MKALTLPFLAVWATLCPFALSAQEEGFGGYPQAYIRHDKSEIDERLKLPIATYVDAAGRQVDLIGAVHIADAAYYRRLNSRFQNYEYLLYEMVDGDTLVEDSIIVKKIKAGTATEEEIATLEKNQEAKNSGGFAMLLMRAFMQEICQQLRFQYQSDGIDYGFEHFVFADMTSQELEQAMKENGDSWFKILLGTAFGDERSFSDIIKDAQETSAAGNDPRALRRIMMKQLLSENEHNSLGDSSIIIARNVRCFEVLDDTLAQEDAKKIGVFYGSAHMPDMHERLMERGFTLKEVEWMTAWKVTEARKQ